MNACRTVYQTVSTECRATRRRNGAVLIIVLWIAFALVSMSLMFNHSMLMEYRAADNAVAAAQAGQAIEGAQRYITYLLKNLEEPARLPDVSIYANTQAPVGEAQFWLIGRTTGDETAESVTFGLTDEASKLNLNTATREMLEMLPTMTPELAAAILDWRDSDSDLSPDGAESQNYLLRTPKYLCKDSAFETVEELRLLIGAEWEILFGEDINLNGILDPNENDGDETPPTDDRDGQLDCGILEYLTIWSREPNTREDGSARINIRSNQSQQLQQYLQETLGQDRANAILGAVGQNRTNIRSVLEFYIRGGVTADEALQIEDALTVSDSQYTTGLINVNTAPAAVLACVPGIGVEYAGHLVAYRTGKSEELYTVAWVLKVLDEQSAIQAGPYLTTRTYQYGADIAAVGRSGKGYRRVFFVFDTSTGEPTVVYRRDRTGLGWALGTDVRDQIASGNGSGTVVR
ncbi:MAG: type II secretion system protein GspK [Candidatus Sumerlaeia bacterium]|nr:type II secretion system protein GspK [Candidatus Sumerlaeia bacterium]